MKIITTIFLALCMFFPFNLWSQETSLIRYIDETSVKLTERQAHLLGTIEARPQSQSVYLITLPNISNVKDKASIKIQLIK